MARLGHLVLRATLVLAIAATMLVSSFHPGPLRWEPQVVAAAHPIHRGLPAGSARVPGTGSGAGAKAVRAALTRLGAPYVWAAAGPHAFDCSGLIVWSFQQAGVLLPHSSQALAAGGQPVSISQMQAGDVITYYADASHVGLYVGSGKMVHASTYGVPVAVVPVDNAPIHNVRRYS